MVFAMGAPCQPPGPSGWYQSPPAPSTTMPPFTPSLTSYTARGDTTWAYVTITKKFDISKRFLNTQQPRLFPSQMQNEPGSSLSCCLSQCPCSLGSEYPKSTLCICHHAMQSQCKLRHLSAGRDSAVNLSELFHSYRKTMASSQKTKTFHIFFSPSFLGQWVSNPSIFVLGWF